ncbi:MAG: DMT family transporter [Paracoccaceae bacterium]
MTDARSTRIATLGLFFGASVWGLYWLPLRALSDMGLSGGWGVVFFNFCPLLVLVPILIWRRRTMFPHLRAALFIGAATGLGLGLYSTSIVLGSVVRMTMEFYLTSVWSSIIGVVWLSERADLRRAITVAAGLSGLLLLLSGGSDDPASGLGLADVLAVTSGILWAFGAAGMKRWPGAHVAATTTFQFVFAVVAGVSLQLLVLSGPVPTIAQLTTAFPMSFLASTLILLPSVYLIFWACRLLFPGRAAVLMMSEAVVAVISATLLLPEETMTGQQWAGGAIVLLACLIGR